MTGYFEVSNEENAALLSPCHIQISLPYAAFCGSRAAPWPPTARTGVDIQSDVLDLF